MPSLIYGDACSTSPYDLNSYDNNIGENLIKKANSGAIGYIGGLRKNWYLPDDYKLEKLNRGNAKLFWKEFFQEKKFQQGKALYDSKVSYITSDYYTEGSGSLNYDYERKQILTYNLLGDPEVDIYTNIPKNVSNPFNEKIYEGQLISSIIRDIDGKVIPNARVNLIADDGKYRTIYANKLGNVNFRIPAIANETYNVTITGHNTIPTYFNFTTLSDNFKPSFGDEECTPKEPTVSDNIRFKIEVSDGQSGIESVYLLVSESDNFDEDYEYYKMSKSFKNEDDEYFEYTINKLDPGEYHFLIVARDWAGNYKILDDNDFQLTIQMPLMDYILIIASLMIIGVAGISVGAIYYENKKFHKRFERLNEF